MTTFSFSTGNPSNLTGGATASMTDISGSLTDIKTFLNGGSITDTNISAGGLTDTSLASPTSPVWRTLFTQMYQGGISALTTTPSWVGGTNGAIPSGSSGSAVSGIWIPPTAGDIAVAGKTTRLRIRVCWTTNATGPGITMTWGLYPITGLAGASSSVIALTLGTVIAGSTVAIASPAATSTGATAGSSFDFSTVTAPTGYVIGCVGSGTQSANSLLACQSFLDLRHT